VPAAPAACTQTRDTDRSAAPAAGSPAQAAGAAAHRARARHLVDRHTPGGAGSRAAAHGVLAVHRGVAATRAQLSTLRATRNPARLTHLTMPTPTPAPAAALTHTGRAGQALRAEAQAERRDTHGRTLAGHKAIRLSPIHTHGRASESSRTGVREGNRRQTAAGQKSGPSQPPHDKMSTCGNYLCHRKSGPLAMKSSIIERTVRFGHRSEIERGWLVDGSVFLLWSHSTIAS